MTADFSPSAWSNVFAFICYYVYNMKIYTSSQDLSHEFQTSGTIWLKKKKKELIILPNPISLHPFTIFQASNTTHQVKQYMYIFYS